MAPNTMKNSVKKDTKRDFQKLVQRLENKILIGGFKPRERLVEARLAKMFNVSRYWIRDALKIMETKGLVTINPYKGAEVSELSEEEIEEIFAIRICLEQLAARLALKNVKPADLAVLRRLAAKIEEGLTDQDLEEMIEADSSFHDYIFQLARNQTLRRMIIDLRNRSHIIRYSAWSSPQVLQLVIKEHATFLEALEQNDPEKINDLSERHITRARDAYLFQLRAGEALRLKRLPGKPLLSV
ncbi:MAG: GntR family transcriptional regulator [Thermodesulfobacteriota bacterium]